jgi:hypothetical protein
MMRSSVLSLPFQLVFPVLANKLGCLIQACYRQIVTFFSKAGTYQRGTQCITNSRGRFQTYLKKCPGTNALTYHCPLSMAKKVLYQCQKEIKPIYEKYVELKNKRAKRNNYTDYGHEWRARYIAPK